MTASDFRIPPDYLTGLDDDHFFWALVEPVWPDGAVSDERAHLAQATPGQRALYSTMLFIRDVDNGGLQQSLWNFEPWFVDVVLTSFDALGAHGHARAVRAGVRALFGSSELPDLSERRAAIEAKTSASLRAEIEPLNEELYGEERLHPFWRQYVAEHRSEFISDDEKQVETVAPAT